MNQINPITISVVIPTYNSADTIEDCIAAVRAGPSEGVEIIVVDDHSTDSTREIVADLDCRLITLERNSGPAYARNTGAADARGEILFFIDSDVILADRAVSIVERYYREHPEAKAVIGMYAKQPANDGIIHHYLALWRYYTWTHPVPEEFSFFIAACGTIRREVFTELGGFDTAYRGAEVEDYEFGHRLGRRHSIVLLPELQGAHCFPGFSTCWRNYFHRSRRWFGLFRRRRRFDSGQAKASTGLSVVLAAGTVAALLASAALRYPLLWAITAGGFVLYGLSIAGFLTLAVNERGVGFGFASFVLHITLSLAVAAGVGSAIVVPEKAQS